MKKQDFRKFLMEEIKGAIMGSVYAKNLARKADKLPKGSAERKEVESQLLESTRSASPKVRTEEVETFVTETRRSGWQKSLLREEVTRILKDYQETENDFVLLKEMAMVSLGAIQGSVGYNECSSKRKNLLAETEDGDDGERKLILGEDDDEKESDEEELGAKKNSITAVAQTALENRQFISNDALEIIAGELNKVRKKIKEDNKKKKLRK